MDGDEIQCSDSMVLLGFKFSNRPNVSAHIDLIVNKFNIRLWLIRHLIQAGVDQKDIVTIFATVIRPVIEYAAPVYQPMMTATHVEQIKKLQQRALKVIYGQKTSYSKTLEASGLPTLAERRKEIMKKFVKKISISKTFERWIPTHRPYSYGLRNELKYQEENAHTERLYNSPIFYIRRLLNNDYQIDM